MSPAAAPAVGPDVDRALQGFVTFEMDGGRYAVRLAEVDEIVRMPKLTSVPLAPPALRGVANLDGRVVPVADLRQCCGIPTRAFDSGTRVLVVHTRGTLGLIVDRVSSVNADEAEELDEASAARSVVGAELVAGVLHESGSAMTTVLDLPAILDREFTLETGSADQRRRSPDSGGVREVDLGASGERVLSFVSAGREYAIPLDCVREIIRFPEKVLPVPHPLPGVIGLIDVRGRVLPLFDARSLLGLEDSAEENDQARAIVLRISRSEGSPFVVALAVDSVRDVVAAEAGALRAVPTAIATSVGAGIERVCSLDGGGRLVPVLSVEALMGSLAAQVSESHGGEETEVEQAPGDPDVAEDEQLIGFVVKGVRYAVPVDDVREIVRHPDDVIRMPDVPSFVVGLCNLRGEVLPLVDMSARVGGEPIRVTESTRVLVASCGSSHLGVVVDAVTDVRRVTRSAIAVPSDLTGRDAPFISGILREQSGGALVLVVAAAALLQGTDLESGGETP